jgi:hypothetical protein
MDNFTLIRRAILSLCCFSCAECVRSGGQRRRQRGRRIDAQRRQISAAIARQLQYDRQRRRHHDQQLALLVYDLSVGDAADHQECLQKSYGCHRQHCHAGWCQFCNYFTI